MQPDPDQRPGLGVQQSVRRRRPRQLIAEVAAAVVDAHGLEILGVGIVHLGVAVLDLLTDESRVQQGPFGQGVHPGHQGLQIVGEDEVRALMLEGVHRRRRAPAQPRHQHLQQLALGDVEVLLGPRQGELLLDDLLGDDEPGMVVLGQIRRGPQVFQRGHGVVTGQGGRREPPSQGVQPQRRRAGQDADGVPGPDRRPVLHPLDVVPHTVAVHEPGAAVARNVQHPSVDIGGNPGDHAPGWRAQPFGPEAPHLVMVAADAA
ncbi:hypothetical protein D3C72_1086620 [compost metagenome]